MLVGLGKAGSAAVVGGLAGGGLVARAVIPEAGAQTTGEATCSDDLSGAIPFRGVHLAG